MSRLPSKKQPRSTHESNYVTETLLEMYGIEEIPNGIFPLKFTTINHYQWGNPCVQARLLSAK